MLPSQPVLLVWIKVISITYAMLGATVNSL